MSKIINVIAREVLDSRGNPTIEVEVETELGFMGRAMVPSGASTGKKEALELRDKDETRYLGKGVKKAIHNIDTMITPFVLGKDCFSQAQIDYLMREIDGTENKSNLGANAILGVSMAIACAASNELGMPLYRYLGGVNAKTMPVPMMNIMNGGAHASNNMDIQEMMIVPVGAPSFKAALRYCVEVYHHLQKILKNNHLETAVGDEGGFAPNLNNDEEAILYILEAIKAAGYKPGVDFMIAIDAASSEWKSDIKGEYLLPKANKKMTTTQLIDHWQDWISKYPIISIEDGLDEEDDEGWQEMTKRIGDKVQLVGDDLFVTNPVILKSGIERNMANSILIKVNQIGTVTEAIEAIEMAKRSGYTSIVSHRSGETEDTFIADLAVALNVGQIKTGAPCRSERVAKYNQLLRIEESLNHQSVYLGKDAFKIK